MNIVEKNEGRKILYSVNGTKITFDDMLTIDLKRYQKDEEKNIDISLNDDDMLQMGLGKWYVANILIPSKEYEVDLEGVATEKSLDMDKVTLTLWELPFNYIEGGM